MTPDCCEYVDCLLEPGLSMIRLPSHISKITAELHLTQLVQIVWLHPGRHALDMPEGTLILELEILTRQSSAVFRGNCDP